MRCRDVMWKGPITLAPEETAQDAVRKLKSADVAAIPVTDETGRYLGMVTERGLVRDVMAEGLDPKLTRVTLILDRGVPSCEPDDPVAVALKRMDEARSRWIAVLESDRVVGLIGTRDIRQAAREVDAHELHALTDAALLH
ncbi:cyclic nucleotide-binding/CBS domain-containing protein [Vulgatibacter incomptus]|uniref:CBS domain protein n=1 Tax=Vulgatibacter incomptus TaxID=1391653 RepID=A0A0K1P7X3_9BACT|nr:CBS domain-containing protein [Vulgatibacter incomptus]AKU89633.1 CBS domain protein [Vulgatibacter incomptus]